MPMSSRILVIAMMACCVPFAQAAANPSLMERLERLETLVEGEGSSGVTEAVERLEVLQREVRRLHGEVEILAHRLEEMELRQRELYLDVDRRLSAIGGAAQAPVSEPIPVPEASGAERDSSETEARAADASVEPVPVDLLPPGEPGQDQARYEAAFELLKDGRYDEATQAFRRFLAQYPGSDYADNAQYWLGEASYVKRDFETALVELGRVVEGYPSSPKVADALLKIGFIHYESGRWEEARKTLELVDRAYPNATAARLARQRLEQMTREGH
jgi:tol-pal system protein YbgF